MARKVDSEVVSSITDKEKGITGQADPVKGGPTAQAQKHVGEDITGEVISDITQGEKKATGGERVTGGPTSQAQSILTKVSFSLRLSNTTVTLSTSPTKVLKL